MPDDSKLTPFLCLSLTLFSVSRPAEQYQAFAKFNEDYISRSLKSSDLTYCS